MPNGNTMWVFGNSHIKIPTIDGDISCNDNIDNCLVIQDELNPSLLATLIDTTQNNRSLFKTTTPSITHFRPGHGFFVHDTAVILLSEMQGDSFLGNAAARLGGITTMDLLDIGRPILGTQAIDFGSAIIQDSNAGFAYIFGSRKDTNQYGNVFWAAYLARCPANDVYGLWEYYAGGNNWSQSQLFAHPISTYPVAYGYSAFELQGNYYLIFEEETLPSDGCGGNKNIIALRSNIISGNYQNPQLLYTATDSFQSQPLRTFEGYAHPKSSHCDSILISYNLNDTGDSLNPNACPGQCYYGNTRKANTWRPQFIKLPYGVLDTQLSPIVSAAFTYTQNGNVWQFHNSSLQAHHYLWEFGDGNVSTQRSPNHTYLSSGSYQVVLHAFGCGDSSISTSMLVQTASPQVIFPKMHISPNPSTGVFTLTASKLSGSKLKIELVDLLGNVLYSDEKKPSIGGIKIPFSVSLPSGIYFLRMKQRNQIQVQKIVILSPD